MAFAADERVTITPKRDTVYTSTGKHADLRVDISPRSARAKGVTYESDDESIATVNARGRVVGVAPGNCNIIVTSKYDETVSIKVPVMVIVPAKQITLAVESKTIKVGDKKPLSLTFAPETTTVQEATFKSTNARIATVDEKGMITAVKAGKVSIVATAVDGSNARGKIDLVIVQPVNGVSYKTPHVRVGVNYHGTFTATLEPKTATNKKMTWESSDPSVATVTGTNNSFRIQGKKWGQSTITGTTDDGGYQVKVVADIGSLRHAVRVVKLVTKNGKPYITLKNASNLNITEVRFQINGYDDHDQPIQMSRRQDALLGAYGLPLSPGETTQHGEFDFYNVIKYSGLYLYDFAITGWSTDTGYYNSKGELLYNFNLAPDKYEWRNSAEFE